MWVNYPNRKQNILNLNLKMNENIKKIQIINSQHYIKLRSL